MLLLQQQLLLLTFTADGNFAVLLGIFAVLYMVMLHALTLTFTHSVSWWCYKV